MMELVILLSIGVLVVGAVVGTIVVNAIAKEKDIDQTPRGDRAELYGWDEDYQYQDEKKLQVQDKTVENTTTKQEESKESQPQEKVNEVEMGK